MFSSVSGLSSEKFVLKIADSSEKRINFADFVSLSDFPGRYKYR